MYDYLIVGAGLYGSTMAYLLKLHGKSCLVIDRRPHLAGNIYTENISGINVHKYGAHIFHTNNRIIWDFVNSFIKFNRYTNSPIANYKGKLFNLPFNMNTFYQMWGVTTPQSAMDIIEEQRHDAIEQMKREGFNHARNLEEQALILIGKDIYKYLIKEYTEKQWGRKANELPAFIIKRLPFRLTFDNNYFSDSYQGIPVGGYTPLVERMLDGVEVALDTDFCSKRDYFFNISKRIIYTGEIDKYFNYCYGNLEYRSLQFVTDLLLHTSNYQGNAVVNYTSNDVPYTRIIEHKHFEFGTQPMTVISKEYPKECKAGDEPYYPINDKKNSELYKRYFDLTLKDKKVLFGGRLAEYKYYDMHQVIESAINKFNGL